MTPPRPVLRENLSYSLLVGLLAVVVAFTMAVVVLVALPKHIDHEGPLFPPSTWTIGDGDAVEVTP